MSKARRVLLGEIAGAHGIRGAISIRAYTSEPERIASYGPLEDEAGGRTYAIAIERVTEKAVIARVAGVADRTAAENLKGTKLYVARERLPEPGADEYYHADLIGLVAVDPQGRPFGNIVAVPNYGAGDLIEIRLSGSKQTELVPLVAAYILAVNVSAGTITVAMPDYVEAGENEGDAASGDGEA